MGTRKDATVIVGKTVFQGQVTPALDAPQGSGGSRGGGRGAKKVLITTTPPPPPLSDFSAGAIFKFSGANICEKSWAPSPRKSWIRTCTREWRVCTQCGRASIESNDQGNSIFLKGIETLYEALYKRSIIIIIWINLDIMCMHQNFKS